LTIISRISSARDFDTSTFGPGAHHLVHHRAQLGICLRLLDVPIPGMHGPSADEPV
jgi:hypothetical protein